MFYVYRNVIWAIRRKNQCDLFRKTYACMENQFLYFSKRILISEFSNKFLSPFVAFTVHQKIRHKNIALKVHVNALGQITQTTQSFVGEKWHTFSLNAIIGCCGPRFLALVNDPKKHWGQEVFKIII